MGAIDLETSERQIFPQFPLDEAGITDAEAVERWRRAHLSKLEELAQSVAVDLTELNEAQLILRFDGGTLSNENNTVVIFDLGGSA